MNGTTAALVLSIVLGAAAPALGQPTADPRLHFEEGVRLFARRDYAGALQAFEASLAIRESASVMYNVAGCYRALGRKAEALRAYRRWAELRGEQMTARERSELDATLRELRSDVAQVTVHVNVEGADVRAGDAPLGREPFAVDPGREIVVEARLQGYQPARTAVRPTGPGPLDVTLTLEPVARPGHARISSTPPGARLSVDGDEVGTTPWSGELAVGAHRIRLEAEGHLAAVSTLEVQAGQEVAREVTLAHVQAASPVPDRSSRGHAAPSGGGSAWPWVLGGVAAAAVAGVVVAVVATQPEELEGSMEVRLR